MKYLETSLEKLARILSRQYNVEVVFEGQGASTNGQKIYLPNFQEISEELERDLNGYLDHEVSHVKFTTFPEAGKVISAYHKELLNGAEDVRIERLMMKEYPGTENHLKPLNEKLHKKLDQDWFSRPWPVRFIIALMRVMDGNFNYPADKEIQPHLDSCKGEIDALNNCKNTREVRIVTEQIVRKLLKDRAEEKEEKKEEQKGEGKKSDKQKGEKSKSQPSSGSGSGEKSDDEQDSSEGEEQDGQEENEEKDQEEKQGQSGDKSDEEKSQDKKDGQGKSDDKSDKKADDKKDGKGQGEGEKKEEQKDFKPSDSKTSKSKEKGDSFLTEKNEAKMEQFEIDVHRLINGQIAKQVEKEKQEMKKSPKYAYEYSKGGKTLSVPYSSRFDEVVDHTGKDSRKQYPRLRSEVKPLANKMKVTLERIFKSVENAKWKSEREQGSINARSLAQLKSNPNYRTVFKQLTKFETDKVAVSILVDLSGSMGGTKIETAQKTAAAMSEALNGLGIKFEVVGFTTGDRMPYSSIPSGADLTRYNRSNETLEHHVFKGFDSTNLSGLANIDAHRNNHDGESVMWAAKRLAARPEKRKILMVMSDGMPNGAVRSQEILQSDLRVKLAQIEKFGIETIGFGILTDCVKHFYKDFVVVNDLRDLTTTCLAKLSKLLTANLPLR